MIYTFCCQIEKWAIAHLPYLSKFSSLTVIIFFARFKHFALPQVTSAVQVAPISAPIIILLIVPSTVSMRILNTFCMAISGRA